MEREPGLLIVGVVLVVPAPMFISSDVVEGCRVWKTICGVEDRVADMVENVIGQAKYNEADL